MGRRLKLTRQLIHDICERVRIGNFGHVAAGACGISKTTYFRWLQTADQEGTPKIFRELRDRVYAASSEARSSAEARVFRENPQAWLRLGPGRGDWTDDPKRLVLEGGVDHNVQIQSQADLQRELIPEETVAGALAIAEQLGLILPGPRGLELFRKHQEELEAELPAPPLESNGDMTREA